MQLEFDRGTVIIRPGASPTSVADLPGIRWDSRVRVWRAPARFQAAIVSELRARGVRFVDRVGRRMDGVSSTWCPAEQLALRDYQRDAVQAWLAAGQRGLIVLPTGAGKTRVAIAAMRALARPTLCLAPTRILVEQWRTTLAGFYGGPVGQLGDGVHDLQAVTVATLASAYQWMGRIGDQFGLLVVDEVHHLGHGLYEEILDMTTAPARLGLTATPPGATGAAALAELVGPVVFSRTVADLAGTALAPFELVPVPVALTAAEAEQYRDLRAQFLAAYVPFTLAAPAATWADFVAATGRSSSGRQALAAWRRARELVTAAHGKREALATLLARHPDARVLVFTADNTSAYRIAREHLIMPITCEIKRRERDDVLAAFRAGTLRHLVSARVLNEGVDVPDADVAIIVGAAAGAREFVQRVGRVLRPRDGKRAVVYELVVEVGSEPARARRRHDAVASPAGPGALP